MNGAARAQPIPQGPPGVTVYGVLDQFVARVKAGNRVSHKVDDGGDLASRVGFRGSEDLGQGWRASFLFEGGFGADTGAGTLPGPAFAWTRQAYVSLAAPWGAVEVGRMYSSMFITLYRADPFGLNAVFSPLNLASINDAQPRQSFIGPRANNMVRLRTATGPGFVADIYFAPGESTADSRKSGNVMGGRLAWSDETAYIGFATQRVKEGSAAAPVPSPTTSTSNAIAAHYRLGDWLLAASYTRNTSSLSTTPKAQIASLGLKWTLSPNWSLAAEGVTRKVDDSPRKQLGVVLGADYALSKRTLLYARALGMENHDTSAVALGGATLTPNSGEDIRTLALGVRHSF